MNHCTIFCLWNFTNTDTKTSSNCVVETWLTLVMYTSSEFKNSFQFFYGFSGCWCRGIWSEVCIFFCCYFSDHIKCGEIIRKRHANKKKIFIVFEDDIIRWLVFLNEICFENKRVAFRWHNNSFNVGYFCNHRLFAGFQNCAWLEITADSRRQSLRFSYIEDVFFCIPKNIDAWFVWKRFQLCLQVWLCLCHIDTVP